MLTWMTCTLSDVLWCSSAACHSKHVYFTHRWHLLLSIMKCNVAPMCWLFVTLWDCSPRSCALLLMNVTLSHTHTRKRKSQPVLLSWLSALGHWKELGLVETGSSSFCVYQTCQFSAALATTVVSLATELSAKQMLVMDFTHLNLWLTLRRSHPRMMFIKTIKQICKCLWNRSRSEGWAAWFASKMSPVIFLLFITLWITSINNPCACFQHAMVPWAGFMNPTNLRW